MCYVYNILLALQPGESNPVSKSSSYSSLSSVDKQSVAESVPVEDKPVSISSQVVLSPALSKTSVASSNKLAVEPTLKTESIGNITASKEDEKQSSTSGSTSKFSSTSVSEDENKDKTPNSTAELRSNSQVSITSHHLPQTNTEHAIKHTDSATMDSYPDASLEASKPSLMVSSLDKQMAELQEALSAAGLPLIDSSNTVNVAPVATGSKPMVRSPPDLPEDIEQVLRELATQEVVSLSRKILHEKQMETQTVSHSKTAQNEEIRPPLHEKLSKDIHIPTSDCNVFSSTENLLAEIGSLKDFSTQSEDEAATDNKRAASVAKKKNLSKSNSKRENVFQRLSIPKSNPTPKKPPAAKKVPPRSVRRPRITTSSSQKKEKQSSFNAQGTYDLKSNTELILDHAANSVRSNFV